MKTLLLLGMLMVTSGAAHAQTFLTQWTTVSPTARLIAVGPDGVVYAGNGYMQRYTSDGTLIPEGWNPDWGLNGVVGVAIAPNGNVWEAEERAAVEWPFDGSNAALAAWSVNDWTSHNEEFTGGVAVDALGRVCLLVNNLDKTRVEVRSQSCVPILTYFCDSGTGIAADHLGNLYVFNGYDNTVTMYSSDGASGRHWSVSESPSNFFSGIAVAPNGNVYVVDTGNYRVRVFTADGVLVSQFGSQGSGPGQFTQPSGVALDAAGNAYVADGTRVEKFGPAVTPARTVSWGSLKATYR